MQTRNTAKPKFFVCIRVPLQYYNDEKQFIPQNRGFIRGLRACVGGHRQGVAIDRKNFEAPLLMPEKYSFQVLAPYDSTECLTRRTIDEQAYCQLLSGAQRLRAGAYLKDGAIQPGEVNDEGCFVMPGDRKSWHFLLIANTEVVGCARYLVHPSTVSYEALRIARSPIALHPEWQTKVREAVQADLRRAREQNFSYVEIGGWALAEEWRGTTAALEILIASYALAHLWGGAFGACMATVRHSSSSILRRIGGSSFQVNGERMPSYEDPHYGCTMELLRFDWRTPAERFIPLINQLKRKLKSATVLSPSTRHAWEGMSREFSSEQIGMRQVVPFYC